MKQITCEVCGSNDLLKQDGVFLCQACGCKYSLEEVKKMMVEITNPVQVVGIDNADTLYNRALEWLNLQNEAKAIEVLKEMIEKYPGDKRGWQKLARLRTLDNHVIENALKFGDDELLAEMEAVAERACADVRAGHSKKWVRARPSTFIPTDFILETAKYYNVNSCVKKLLEEGKESADYFNQLWGALVAKGKGSRLSPYRHYHYAMEILLKRKCDGNLHDSYLRNSSFQARIIVGNMILYTYVEDSITCENALFFHEVLTELAIEEIFDEVEHLLANSLCPYCSKKNRFSLTTERGHCPACKKWVPWFRS